MNAPTTSSLRVGIFVALNTVLCAGRAFGTTPADLEGRPVDFKAGEMDGVALYTVGTQLRILFTSSGKERLYHGKFCSKGELSGLSGEGLEEGDSLKLSPERKCVWFKFRTGRDLDGFALDIPSRVVFFDPRENRAALTPARIWLGHAGRHPTETPLSLRLR